MITHPRDNDLTFKNPIIGCAVVEGCGIYHIPGDNRYAREPRKLGGVVKEGVIARGCDNEGVFYRGGVVIRGGDNEGV